MENKKNHYVTKQEILQILKDKYSQYFTIRSLQFYIDEQLINSGSRGNIMGFGGPTSYYSENTPGLVFAIQELEKSQITLKDIKSYKDAIYEFNEDLNQYFLSDVNNLLKINSIDNAKFRTALTYFAAAEADIQLNSQILPLISITGNGKIKEIHVCFKKWIPKERLDTKNDIETRFTAELILLKRGNTIMQPEEQYVLNRLKTIKEVIFSKDLIQVL